MATPPRSSVGERQERPISTGRVQLPRRSTRGPVDLSQAPVSGPLGSSSPTLSNSQTLSPTHSQRSPNPSSRPTSSPAFPAKDFSRLLRPELYHPLPTTDIPAPLRPSSPPPQDLPTLLSTSRFRAAAVLAANLLTTATAPTDHPTIFALLYVRLASLTLCNATALAAQEVKALEDLNSALYLDPLTSAHLVPWELRVLAVRLQGIGFNDPRRGVVGYFELARDARRALTALRKAVTEDPESGDATLVERHMWEERLVDLGVRVAGALVEMEDLEGAAMHLRTLGEGGDRMVGARRALLWLRLGDVEAARGCVGGREEADGVVLALGEMADGKYEDAATIWEQLAERDGGNEMYAQNLAVCMLYSGQIDEAKDMLEDLLDKGKSFHALTFNLSTIYELCTDRSRQLKLQLVEKVAAMPEADRAGWEKTNADFKL
ncbi:hypothetical protein VF21_01179 [Pseudogymnoascus sp. 05NY08]|nr:hypothetical protein VF21_01179 [Pseudogymnoascus sp. 05NY08]